MASGHVGSAYTDKLADAFQISATNFRITEGSLPSGLFLDAAGNVSGTPDKPGSKQFRVEADTTTQPLKLRVAITVFSVAEDELPAQRNFEYQGPFKVDVRSEQFSWVSSFDGRNRQDSVYIFTPESSAGDSLPLLVFHRGRGFSYGEYANFLSRISSWGIVVVSILDKESFQDTYNPQAANTTYDIQRPELGMENASAAQEAACDFVLELSKTRNDPLEGRVDPDSVFFSGHSRGGGATQASCTRALDLKIRGVVYFMQFDLKFLSDTDAPGVVPAYSIPITQPRLPSLIFAAEKDSDVKYPAADQLIDRTKNGPVTFVTVYGADHNSMTDYALSPRREREHDLIAGFVIAFVRRWSSKPDFSAEQTLYGQYHTLSKEVGVAYRRNVSPTLLIDNFQGNDPSKNQLGGTNSCFGLHETVESPYLNFPVSTKQELSAGTLAFDDQNSVFRLSLGRPVDISKFKSLSCRIKQTSDFGWQIDGWVSIRESLGIVSSKYQITAEDGSQRGVLAPWQPGDPSMNRFVTMTIPIDWLTKSNPGILLNSIESIEFQFSTTDRNRQIVVDDIRFE